MNDQTYVFEKNPMGEACPQVENTYTPSLQGRKQSKPDTAGHVQAQTIGFHVWWRSTKSDRDKELTAYTTRMAKSLGTCQKSTKNCKEASVLVQIWKSQGRN